MSGLDPGSKIYISSIRKDKDIKILFRTIFRLIQIHNTLDHHKYGIKVIDGSQLLYYNKSLLNQFKKLMPEVKRKIKNNHYYIFIYDDDWDSRRKNKTRNKVLDKIYSIQKESFELNGKYNNYNMRLTIQNSPIYLDCFILEVSIFKDNSFDEIKIYFYPGSDRYTKTKLEHIFKLIDKITINDKYIIAYNKIMNEFPIRCVDSLIGEFLDKNHGFSKIIELHDLINKTELNPISYSIDEELFKMFYTYIKIFDSSSYGSYFDQFKILVDNRYGFQFEPSEFRLEVFYRKVENELILGIEITILNKKRRLLFKDKIEEQKMFVSFILNGLFRERREELINTIKNEIMILIGD